MLRANNQDPPNTSPVRMEIDEDIRAPYSDPLVNELLQYLTDPSSENPMQKYEPITVTSTADILYHIFSFLNPPELAIVSKVNRDWHQTVTADVFITAKLKHLSCEDMLQLGKKHLRIAKIILTDPNLYGRLSFNEFIQLSASHETIVLKILSDEKTSALLDEDSLFSLAKDHEKAVLFVLANEQLTKKLRFRLSTFCAKHKAACYQVLNTAQLLDMTRLSGLSNLGSYHPEIANCLLERKLIEDLNQLVFLSCHHYPLAVKTFVTQMANLNSSHLVHLGKAHFSFAKAIVSFQPLWNKLGPDELMSILIKHEALAIDFLNNKINIEFNPSLEAEETTELAKASLFLAKQMFDDPFYSRDLSTHVSIAKYHVDLVEELLQNEEVSDRLTRSHLVALGSVHPFIAEKIMGNTKFRNKLGKEGAVMLAFHHQSIATLVLNDTAIWALLSSSEKLKIIAKAEIGKGSKMLSLLDNDDPYARKVHKKFEMIQNVASLLSQQQAQVEETEDPAQKKRRLK